MGLGRAVKLGFRKELAAVEDPEERKALLLSNSPEGGIQPDI